MSINSQLSKILDELNDDNIKDSFTEEELTKLRKELNPYGRTIEGADKICTLSYTDLRKEYLKKLLVTTFIGYMNRSCDEWNVPDNVMVVPVYDYVKNPSLIAPVDKKNPTKDELENMKWMERRVIVKEFLEDIFQFNPDKHVRSAYRPNPEDPERPDVVDTPAAKLAVEHNSRTEPMLKTRVKKAGGRRKAPPRKPATKKRFTDADATEKDETLENNTLEMIPPSDLFYRFDNYYNLNYEQLRDVVNQLYCEKPDIETAINPYQWHNDRNEVDAFIDAHKDEVITTIYPCHSGKWNMIGPFKQVRDRVNFYNNNTVILEEIMKQRELDERIGQDLMKKTIKIKKKKNIEEAGPDDPSFVAWAKNNNPLKQLENKSNNNDVDPECPDDAVQVDVFRISHTDRSVKKEHFFTEAEAPHQEKEEKEEKEEKYYQ